MAENYSLQPQEELEKHTEAEASATPDIQIGQSRAVTVYEGQRQPLPTTIKWLDLNFDLKVPPHNWMRASSPLEKYVLKALYSRQSKKSPHMSSIAMAHSNVDLIDSIDVISDAKNIKRLLQIPYAEEQPLSLMIHRVGKTLLIDEFDIHKHLLRRQQDDWKWMREFYNDLVKASQAPPRVQQTQQRLTERNIFSKLLYHSIAASGEDEPAPSGLVSPQRLSSRKSQIDSQSKASFSAEDDDEMYFSDDSELGEESEFSQQMEWKFEDIKMMIGTDLPIFTDDSSCVSLRLRDANSPITVLTGLEYWLDNLMCNVPEIAMCYHQDGFVQRYEKLNTSEIPHIKDSEFKPEFVKDIAQNILSFLRSNATKIGHTYWLYKEKKGDIVKLYDLTTLTNGEQSQLQNPFRHPLAHLLFRVALKLHKEKDRSKSGVIQALLTNCLALAPEARSQIAVTAHIILCQLYTCEDNAEISTDIFKQHNIEDDGTCTELVEGSVEDEAVDDVCRRLDLASLSRCKSATAKVKNFTSQFPPVGGSTESRCEEALNNVAEGLRLIDRDIDSMETQAKEGEPLPRSPSVAIPLSYQPLTKEVGSGCADSADTSMELFRDRLGLFAHTWHRQSKADLLSKAMYCCYKLAASMDQGSDYGKSLKYIKLALLCYDAITLLDQELADERLELFYLTVRLCGDTQLKMRSEELMDIYSSDCKSFSPVEDAILKSTLKDICKQSFVRLYTLSSNAEHRMLTALLCYRQSQSHHGDDSANQEAAIVVQRLGNCCNELGQFYTCKAKALILERETAGDTDGTADVGKFLAAADRFMKHSLEYFTVISDRNNLALVNVNMTKLLRLRSVLLRNSMVYTKEEQLLYLTVSEHYKQALSMLGKRDNCPQIWDLVVYEQMEAMLDHSLSLEDHTVQGMTGDQVDKELTSVLMKLLKHYECTDRQRNAADIHHRLGLKLDGSYRECLDVHSQKSKRLRTMAETHYDKAMSIFSSMESSSQEIMRIIVDKLCLWKFDLDGCSTVNARRRHLETGLALVVDAGTCTALECLGSDDKVPLADEQTLATVLRSFAEKVQLITLNLVKLSSQSVPSHRKAKNDSLSSAVVKRYKDMYRESLSIDDKQRSSVALSQSILRACRAIGDLAKAK